MSASLGEMLQSTETATIAATPDTAPVEPTQPITDQSATVDPPAVADEVKTEAEQPKPETTEPPTLEQQAQAKAEQDFKQLREHKATLETELTGMRAKLNEYGGESHLQIMQPLLKLAAEIPRSEMEMDTWSEGMWKAVNSSLLPAQADALRVEAGWSYLRDPQGQQQVCKALYGDGVTPEIIKEFVGHYKADPTVMDLLRPEETDEQKSYRLSQETREQASQQRIQQLEDSAKKAEAAAEKQAAQQVMTRTAEVGFAPRAEIKKQFGLEFHQNGDTPEIASFKQRVDARYEKLTTLTLMNDPQMNQLWSFAEELAKQKDPQQRQRVDGYMLQIQERTRAVCAEVAKELAEDLKLFSPELSDQARVKGLKDLPANVAGGNPARGASSGFDLSDMPDATTNPRGYEAWVSRKMAENAQQRGTPAILQAG